jgi:NAD(P)-dependent dehydrogenase (short-subunit alcohol dehydrogenase family)
MPNVLVTGTTSGLGLATAEAAAARGAHVLVAGRDADRVHAVADNIDGEPVVVDLADLGSVRAAAADLPHVDAIACNAAVQIVKEVRHTRNGLEETFAVNHLAHLALVDALMGGEARPGRAIFVTSATHDPDQWTGTPAPSEDAVARLARPAADTPVTRTAGMRRYTTTKLLALATSAALAREHPDVQVLAFDPGVLPDTGLAREHPAPVRVAYGWVFRLLRFLPFASSARASGSALATLLCEDPRPHGPGCTSITA